MKSLLYLFSLLAVAGVFMLAQNAPATPALPVINTNNVVNILDFGATNSATLTNTIAIQNAINSAATTNGGCTVEIPPGNYLCGPITLANNINLQIDTGAVLRMLSYTQYPGGIINPPNFISASGLHDIEISGSGAIDGQGAPWWPGYKTNNRPIMIYLSNCNRQWIQGVTLSNSPMFHISISGSHAGNTTVQGVTVLAPPSSGANPASHNTDACDVAGTNILVENCNISTGDDDFTCGGGTFGVLLTNNTYGNGHGISIGSYTDSGGVSNITVINCTMNGTDNGIRIKSDNDRGGLVQNISYFNIGMTNVDFPIQIYSYYNEIGTPSSISPYYAATQAVVAVSGTTPIYRNITFSNINATSVSGYPIGIIWARTEMPATNIVFNKVNITGDRNFCLYNVKGAQFIDCNLKPSSSTTTFALFNAQPIITNSTPATGLVTLSGLITNGYANSLALYNASASLNNTNTVGSGPLTLGASTLAISNNFTLFPATALNFALGTNPASVLVSSNLVLGGSVNITNGSGFTNGTYVLLTYGKSLGGTLPTLGSVPAGYNYTFDTNTLGVVKLIASLPAPPAPTNLLAFGTNLLIALQWNGVAGVTNYNLKRGIASGGPYPTVFGGLTTTNYADAAVTNAVTYYYVVTAVNGGESTNSLPAVAVPLPSAKPTNIVFGAVGGQMQLSWPQDHQGWRLQIQTNKLSHGLGTNWYTVPNSTNLDQISLPLNPANGSVFLRLVYP